MRGHVFLAAELIHSLSTTRSLLQPASFTYLSSFNTTAGFRSILTGGNIKAKSSLVSTRISSLRTSDFAKLWKILVGNNNNVTYINEGRLNIRDTSQYNAGWIYCRAAVGVPNKLETKCINALTGWSGCLFDRE